MLKHLHITDDLISKSNNDEWAVALDSQLEMKLNINKE